MWKFIIRWKNYIETKNSQNIENYKSDVKLLFFILKKLEVVSIL